MFTYTGKYLDNLKQEAKKISNVSPLKPLSLVVHANIMAWKKKLIRILML